MNGAPDREDLIVKVWREAARQAGENRNLRALLKDSRQIARGLRLELAHERQLSRDRSAELREEIRVLRAEVRPLRESVRALKAQNDHAVRELARRRARSVSLAPDVYEED